MSLIENIETGIRSATRLIETTSALTEAGLSWLAGKPAPEALRRSFERLGAGYVKLGQFIASTPSLFPAAYVEEFQRCLDQTEPLPFATVEGVLKRELGRPLNELFESIDPKPLASASIAQVHGARLPGGEDVVLKIQKPGVVDTLLMDLNFLYASMRALELLAPQLARTSLAQIVGDIQKTALEECDFLREARYLGKFRDFLRRSNLNNAVVPQVYPALTTSRVITMERLYGVPLTDPVSIGRYSGDPEATLLEALDIWLQGLFHCDFFHADVHAGNLLVLKDGRLGFIDFGIVGSISPQTKDALRDFMDALVGQDFGLMAESLQRMGAADAGRSATGLGFDLEQLFGKLEQLPQSVAQGDVIDRQINAILVEMALIGEKHGLRFPREFALLVKQMLYFDRYARILAPEMNILTTAGKSLPPGGG